ncbi:MAG: hypothetical protein ACYS7Y_29125 [Planctomycetota bacterium]|jgi:hypothetical protein
MPRARVKPIVTFERDVPVLTFNVTQGGQPVRLLNYSPELHVLDPDGDHVLKFPMEIGGLGTLSVVFASDAAVADLYEDLFKLVEDNSYKAQIFLRSEIPLTEGELGLYDIIDPDWLDYVPPEDLVLAWASGVVYPNLTIPTEIPWQVRESIRLRGFVGTAGELEEPYQPIVDPGHPDPVGWLEYFRKLDGRIWDDTETWSDASTKTWTGHPLKEDSSPWSDSETWSD